MSKFKEALEYIWGIKPRRTEEPVKGVFRYETTAQFHVGFTIEENLALNSEGYTKMCERRGHRQLAEHIYGGILEALYEHRRELFRDFHIPFQSPAAETLDRLIGDLENGMRGYSYVEEDNTDADNSNNPN